MSPLREQFRTIRWWHVVGGAAASLAALITALLGTGGIVAAYQVYSDNRNHREERTSEQYIELLSEMREIAEQRRIDYDALRGELETLREEIAQLRAQNVEQASRIAELQGVALRNIATLDAMEVPMWIKDREGIVLFVNRAYEREFLIPRGYTREDYIGQTDFAVWPDNVARSFRQHDRRVIESGLPFSGYEMVEQPDGTMAPWRIHKWLIKEANMVFSIGGMGWRDLPEAAEKDTAG